MTQPRPTLRIDKWLWHARFFKTRSLATRIVEEGAVRVNSARVTKPATAIGAGDVLTFAQGQTVRVVRVISLPDRRGPASEAQACYADLSEIKETVPEKPQSEGHGRPSKRERRQAISLRQGVLE
ncbi:RNA-binding S4 domain-containing protein [Roseobacter sp. HKCC-CH-9208]|uniref:RNA-binding S4 domain-containing protein n=1 Tax=Roseobacter sp. HKCC-CH-9208 TaxID=3120339 RepID=UPI0030ED470D